MDTKICEQFLQFLVFFRAGLLFFTLQNRCKYESFIVNVCIYLNTKEEPKKLFKNVSV
jgi:hypothetical protein